MPTSGKSSPAPPPGLAKSAPRLPAPALAAAARALLPQAGRRQAALDDDLTAAEQAVRDLPRPRPAERAAAPQPGAVPMFAGWLQPHPRHIVPALRAVPGPAGPHEARPTLASQTRDDVQALQAVTDLEAAARNVLTEVTTGLEPRWSRVDAARERAAAAWVLLRNDGPRQAELTARMAAAVGRLYEIGPARLIQPGTEPVTVTELEAARHALAGSALAIEAAAVALDRVTEDVLDTAPARWDERLAQAMRLETYAAGLAGRLGDQADSVISALRELDRARTALVRPPGPASDTAAIEAAGISLIAMADATERLDATVRATALGRADALLGPGHGLDLARATAVMDLADRLFLDYLPGQTDAQRFARLAALAGVRNREDARVPNLGSRDQRPAIARLVGLLWLATQAFDDPRTADLADLTDLRRAGRHHQDRVRRPPP